ncbi:acetyl-CoA carboxylase biotin carboxyl carrier protein [Micromonospora rosaria]|uniref:acetyl-CoA carboxylase biotin carboxyl carrier protein n=1 Tax=Micromonospora rosaria TaxID=47874 RepID=UPI000A8768EF|nr:acetyl-CoA carboxylase biotin carboxyl carrier protein [Micromonospora rosaria]
MTAQHERRGVRDPRDALEAVALSAIELARRASARPRRISVRHGDTSVEIEWEAGEGGPAAPAPADPAVGADGDAASGHEVVRSPVVGTFYRAPEPGMKPFVEVGDAVERGQQVGIVEAMKLMNGIQSEVTGRVVEILVADATPVEYGQPLIVVAPLDVAVDRGE